MVSKGNHPKMAELFRVVKYDNLPRCILWVWGSPSRLLNGFLFLNVSKQRALSSCHFDLFVLFRFWGLNRITNLDNLGWWWIFRHMQFYMFSFFGTFTISKYLINCLSCFTSIKTHRPRTRSLPLPCCQGVTSSSQSPDPLWHICAIG